MSRKTEAQEKAVEGKNRGWPKGKRRYPKGAGAPKQPLSGYVHFLNERRETVRAENPDITFSDLSKKLAAEWSALGEADKNRYNEQAKRDKDRYDKEFLDYQQTDSYKQYLQSESLRETKGAAPAGGGQPSKKKKKPAASTASSSKRPSLDESDTEVAVVQETPQHLAAASSFDVPIFTEEFLDHNRARELELRQLRKQTSEFEEQNAVLGKHIDSMKSAISKLEVETVQQRQSNAGLQQQLDLLRQMVVASFRGVAMPGVEPVTAATVDQFVSRLHGLTEQGSISPTQQALLNTAREVVGRMDFSKIPA